MLRSVSMLALCALAAAPALAQRADDNAARQADDAFGKSVGNERVGIYNPNDVRGFSPEQAGNVRLEGLYFDKQAGLTDRLVDGSTVRVGLAAQGYPFPAPTGIAEYALRRPGEELLVSPVLNLGPYGGWTAELDTQIPVIKNTLGIAAGVGISRGHDNFGGTPQYFSLGIVPVWRPATGIEITPFYGRIRVSSQEAQPLVATTGAYFPPKIDRLNYYGQPWAVERGTGENYGVAGSMKDGPWLLRAGVFRSMYRSYQSFASLYLDTTPDGRATSLVVAAPQERLASTSGEVRLSRYFDEGDRRHTLHFTLRGRERHRTYGGEDVVNLGQVTIGVPAPVPEPVFAFGPQSRDTVAQRTAGAAYQLNWRNIGEFSAGVQKTDYRKDVTRPTGALPTSKDNPWLINATAALTFVPRFVFYAGFTRGLEESPSPPDNAVNRGDAPPAIRTRQVDAGVRWAIKPDLKLIAGVFEVSKPFFDLDPAGVFGRVGEVRNRGVELSLAGALAKGLNVVAGTVFLDPVVSGAAFDRGEIGRRPVGSMLRNSFASLDYRFADSGFSVDSVVESTGTRFANQANTLTIPPRAVLHLGGRYRFKSGGHPVTVRAQVGNVFNNYGFGAVGGGLLVYNLPRRLTISIAADI